MNTTTTTSPAVLAARRVADAAEAMQPYWKDGTYKDAPPATENEFAEAIMGVMPIWQKHETVAPDLAQSLLAWAQYYIEHRDYPEFFAAKEELRRIREEHGDEATSSIEHFPLLLKMMRSAPPRFMAVADAVLKEALPTATHVDDQGQPVFSIEQLADKFNRPVEQVEADIQRMSDMGITGFLHSGPAHPIQ